jgi:hypothetical protein
MISIAAQLHGPVAAALSLWTPQNTLAVEELRPMDFISSLVI